MAYYDNCPAYPDCKRYMCECKDIDSFVNNFKSKEEQDKSNKYEIDVNLISDIEDTISNFGKGIGGVDLTRDMKIIKLLLRVAKSLHQQK